MNRPPAGSLPGRSLASHGNTATTPQQSGAACERYLMHDRQCWPKPRHHLVAREPRCGSPPGTARPPAVEAEFNNHRMPRLQHKSPSPLARRHESTENSNTNPLSLWHDVTKVQRTPSQPLARLYLSGYPSRAERRVGQGFLRRHEAEQ
jgi:hypothetical protein